MLRAHQGPWFVYKLGPQIMAKTTFENNLDETKPESKPCLNLFGRHFVVKWPIQGPDLVERVSRHSILQPQVQHFVEKIPGPLLNGWLQPHPTNWKVDSSRILQCIYIIYKYNIYIIMTIIIYSILYIQIMYIKLYIY